MAKVFWWSADVDTGEVIAKTEIKDNGEVARFDYTEPDHIDEGHGDKRYEDLEHFIDDDPYFERDKDDPESKEREWHGNGFDIYLNYNYSLLSDENLCDVNTLVLKRKHH